MPHQIRITGANAVIRARAAPGGFHFDDHFTLVREFNGVADQIHQNLAQACDIADQNFGDRIIHDVSQVQFLFSSFG